MDLGKYWNDVRAAMAALPRQRIYYVISIENSDKGVTAGRVMDIADPKQVARLLVGRTHVLATSEQIAQHQLEQERQNEELAAIEMARKGQLAMPKELQDLVRLATRSVAPEQPQPAQPAPAGKPKEK